MTRPVGTKPFHTEAEAVDFVVARLMPFATSLKREPVLGSGLRPDIGFRLKALPNVPIAIECKQFSHENKLANLTDAIAQAGHYAEQTKHAAFVGPLVASGAMSFHADCRVAGAMLVAAQLSVGGVAFTERDDTRITTLVIGGQSVATLMDGGNMAPDCRLHPNAVQLLTYKHRWGSTTWRKSA